MENKCVWEVSLDHKACDQESGCYAGNAIWQEMERRALEYKIRVKNEFFLKNKLYICKNENKKHVSLKQDKTNFPQPITQLQN